jgi:hypothetical protein
MSLSPSTADTPVQWGFARRILFRFLFAYLFLYNPVALLNTLPEPQKLFGSEVDPYTELCQPMVKWVGRELFGVEITILPNGSGDTTFNYVQVFCFAVLAAVVALLWTLFDGKRGNYSRLHGWLWAYMRFTLAANMLIYGAFKVIKSQFPDPSLDRLTQPFGDASPMGLLWTFMGASESYTIFTGFSEMLGGLLLTARRTTLLGALVCVGVLANIVMLNFSYDVPVKLLSAHLLLMAAYVAAPDLRRLANLFVLNRVAAAAPERRLVTWNWLHRGVLGLRAALVIGFTGYTLWYSYETYTRYGPARPRPPLYGIWNVAEFTLDGELRPPLVSDQVRWRRVTFDFPGVVSLQLMNDTRQRYRVDLQEERKTMTLLQRDPKSPKAILTFSESATDLLVLQGTYDGHSVRAKLKRSDDKAFPLTSRGFHWINEYPFNR